MWDSEKLGRQNLLTRLTFVGLISLADDEGRGRGEPTFLRGRIHPYAPDVTIEDFKKSLSNIIRIGLASFYEIEGCHYYALSGWKQNQYIEKPSRSMIPDPPKTDESGNGRGIEGDDSPLEGKGRDQGMDGKGKDNFSGEPQSDSPQQVDEMVLEFQVVGKGGHLWPLTKAKLQEYEGLYPNLNVLGLCSRMRQWCIDNPGKKKTARGMPAFIGRWLAKEADRPKGGTNGTQANKRLPAPAAADSGYVPTKKPIIG